MKREDITLIIAVVIVAATLSYVISTSLFGYNQQSNTVPVVEVVDSSLPDPYNDPAYKVFFNSNAIDPTQLTHIGSQNNSSPFGGSQ